MDLEAKTIYTVVVADDEEELLEAVCQMVPWEEIGFRLVGSAGNGLDALELVEQMQPDLLLTDIHMPFISGVNLAKQVRELHPLTQIAFLSGYDDFEYAQKAIEYNIISYLLKPISMQELTSALREMHGKIQENYNRLLPRGRREQSHSELLLSLLLDNFPKTKEEANEMRTALTAAGILEAGQGELSLTVLAGRLERDGKNCTNMEFANTVDMVLRKYFSSFSVYSGGRIFTLAVGAERFEQINLAVQELNESARRVLNLSCNVGVSRTVHKLGHVGNAAREAVDALRFAGNYGGIHPYASLLDNEKGETPDLAGLPSQLENLLRTGTRSRLEQYLDKVMGNSRRAGNLAALQCLSTALRVLHCSFPKETVATVCGRCNLLDSQKICGGRELEENVKALCLLVRDRLEQLNSEGVSLQCNQAMEAINREYMNEDLSLSSVSARLHVSPNYLSANMKKYVGDTFINLLIKRRMEAAHDLLSNRSMKIYEVAQMCGYSDQHYFSYCFKKYYGVSPIKLRQQEEGTV